VTKLLNHLKHNVVAYLALFVALGGSSYAAINLPAGSVGSKQLRNGAVTNKKLAKGTVGPAKLDTKTIAGYVRGYAQIDALGRITTSRPSAKVIIWRTGTFQPGGEIEWSRPFPKSCFAVANTAYRGTVSYANALLSPSSKTGAATNVSLSTPGQAVNVTIICPAG
jgi:hypothetical protein